MQILIESSARHIHLSEIALKKLFGDAAVLTNKKDLSQPGQFACVERVDIIGPKGELKGVSILGPVRSHTQVELSLTDARKLGITPPVRESGDITSTPGCHLVGPSGTLDIDHGVIAAKRHIHLDPQSALKFKLNDRQIVSVAVKNLHRSVVFGDVVVRVSDNFVPAMHVDTDEANSAGIVCTTYGDIIV